MKISHIRFLLQFNKREVGKPTSRFLMQIIYHIGREEDECMLSNEEEKLSTIEIVRRSTVVECLLTFSNGRTARIPLEKLSEVIHLITEETLWFDKRAFEEFESKNYHYLTEKVRVFIQNDFDVLRHHVWASLEKNIPPEEQWKVNMRKDHTLTVVKFAKKLFKKCVSEMDTLSVVDKSLIEYIIRNDLTWVVPMIAYLHDMYKLSTSPLGHGAMAAMYFTMNICDGNSDIENQMEEAIRYHSYPKMNIPNILYKILVDADILSKYTISYIEYKKQTKYPNSSYKKIIKKITKELDKHEGYCIGYSDMKAELLNTLHTDMQSILGQ